MADKAFGVKQLNILGSGTPSIESPSDLNINAVKVAISTNLTVGGASTFTGNISANGNINANGNIVGDNATNISGINSVTATTYFGDGSSLTGVGGTDVLEKAGINTSGTSTFTNLNVSGVITATTFSGNLVGNVTGTASKATDVVGAANRILYNSSTDNTTTSNNLTFNGTTLGVTGALTVDNIQLNGNQLYVSSGELTIDSAGGKANINDNLYVQGVSEFNAAATFNSSVSIAGSITYDDVTNVDSVGLITARSGIIVGAGITAAGIITATSFSGDGSQLTGIGINTTGTSTFNQLKVTGVSTFSGNIAAGSNLFVGYSTSIPLAGGFDPSIQQVGTNLNSSTFGIYRFSADTNAPSIRFIKSRSSNPSSRGLVQFNDELGRITFIGDDGSDLANGGARISAHVDGVASATADMPARLSFYTAPDGTAGGQERLTIKNDGLIGIGSVLPTQMLDVGGNIKGVSISAGSSITGTNLYGTLASGDVATSANSVVLGRVSGGAGSVEELTPAQIRTLLNVADGATAGSGIGNVVEDGTPELGGYLDLNNKGIFGVGVITATSFVGSGASLTALPPLTNSKSVLNPSYPQTGTFTVWLAARYNTTWDHYMIDSGNFGSGVSADRTGNISGADVDININVGDTLILDTATQATLNNAAGPTSIKTTPGTGSANRVSNPAATNNGTSSSNITWTPTVAGTYYYQNESRVNMRGQIIVSPTASPPASKFISDINFNSEGRVVGVVTFNGINAGSKATRGIIQIHDDPNLTVNTGIVSITQSLNLTGIVTAASFSGSGIGLTSLPAAQLTGSLPAINAANLTNLSSSQLTGALPAISGAALTGIQYTGITTISGQLNLNGMSKETINIVANKLSAATNIDLEDGLVHYFSTTETADATPNIRFNSSTTLNSKLSVGDSVTVTIISVTDNTNDSYEQLTIDGSAVTEQWLGGAPPGGGSSGYDVYTYQIIKTADATYLVFANKVNFT